jgi:hypothetical protein
VLINNARSVNSVDYWDNHLEKEDNDRTELIEIRGLNADTLRESLEEMQRLARDSNPRLKNTMYHADFNPRLDEVMTPEQRDRAIGIFEDERGIPPNTPRLVMEHVKYGRVHWHVIWLLASHQRGRAGFFR